nr:selenocysteine-specific translation elongation factor [Bacillus testis]
MKKHITIGLAGHIDHGKTSLTKALTNVDTDTLKEEKQRAISIELGFAPYKQTETQSISIIDVPGHEKFIKKMIAGVSGIDCVILTVAADEGVMPQTKEHLAILQYLGIPAGMVAITKCDRVDKEFLEIVKEEIRLELEGTIFEGVPLYEVDSLSKRGIPELKEAIERYADNAVPKGAGGEFRLPIDQVFTVKGQGTIVRGTVNEGHLREGEDLYILPSGKKTKARQLQVHHSSVPELLAGQRGAVNLAGVDRHEVKRGDVLVGSKHMATTDCLDVSLSFASELSHAVKQRMPIACYIGTSEVLGRIVFFDRNELGDKREDILCQLRLEQPVVAKRGDRVIIRRPSPQETIGGGWVIDPYGEKYKYGEETIAALAKKRESNNSERVSLVLRKQRALTAEELSLYTSVPIDEINQIIEESESICAVNPELFMHSQAIEEGTADIVVLLEGYHRKHPMKPGMPKAELLQKLESQFHPVVSDFLLKNGKDDKWTITEQHVAQQGFLPSVPDSWAKKAENMLGEIRRDGVAVTYFGVYAKRQHIPDSIASELKAFWQEQGLLEHLAGDYYIHRSSFTEALEKLRKGTAIKFTVTEAKDILGLSRKYMIPFLEKLDEKQIACREGDFRTWL